MTRYQISTNVNHNCCHDSAVVDTHNDNVTVCECARIEEAVEIAKAMNNQHETNENAERYKYIREQFWNDSDLFVVVGGKKNVLLGTICPSKENLDQLVDERRLKKGKPNEPNSLQ